MIRSAGYALLTTGICLALAYPTAYYMARCERKRRRSSCSFSLWCRLWTSFLIRTYAWDRRS